MRPLLLLLVAVSAFAADPAAKLRIYELGVPGADKLSDLPARYAEAMSMGYTAEMPNPVFRLSNLAFLPADRSERLDLYVQYAREPKVRPLMGEIRRGGQGLWVEARAEAELASAAGRSGDELRAEIARYSSSAIDSVVTGTLDDPFLKLFTGPTLLREKDDWDSPASFQPALRTAFTQVGAFPFADRQEPAMLVTLRPGSYTAQASGLDNNGASNPTGTALLEIYELP